MKRQYSFHFRTRMCMRDWNTLGEIIKNHNRYYRNKGHRDYLFNQVNRFVREVCIPFNEAHRNLPVTSVEKVISIRDGVGLQDFQLVSVMREFVDLMGKHQHHTSMREWLTAEMGRFIKDVAQPYINENKGRPPGQPKELSILIPEVAFEDSYNIQKLVEYSDLKGRTPTHYLTHLIDASILKYDTELLHCAKPVQAKAAMSQIDQSTQEGVMLLGAISLLHNMTGRSEEDIYKQLLEGYLQQKRIHA